MSVLRVSGLLLISFLVRHSAQAQTATIGKPAIFQYAKSYTSNNPEYEINSRNPGERLEAYIPFHVGKIRVWKAGRKKSFSKAGIYGYRDKNGFTYRFQSKQYFRIEDTTAFYIYSRYQPGFGKTVQGSVLKYYFSISPDSPIQAMTVANLLSAFSSNRAFYETVKRDCPKEKDLLAFDDATHSYLIEHIYLQSLREGLSKK